MRKREPGERERERERERQRGRKRQREKEMERERPLKKNLFRSLEVSQWTIGHMVTYYTI